METFVRGLEQSATGSVCLRNLVNDLVLSRLDSAVTRSFLERLRMAWDAVGGISGTPEDLFWKEVEADPSLVCRGPRLTEPLEGCARIMTASDFAHRYLDHSKCPTNPRKPPGRRLWQLVETQGLARYIKRGVLLSNRRGFAWATPANEIRKDCIRLELGARAEHLRDYLGLQHLDNAERLLAVFHPPGQLRGRLHAPTFFDSSPSFIYRSVPTRVGWGCAARLSDYTDGYLEGVHHGVPISGAHTVIDLGKLPLPPAPRRPGRDFLRSFPFRLNGRLRRRILSRW